MVSCTLLFFISLFCSISYALPVSGINSPSQPQIVFYTQKTQWFDKKDYWYDSQEYGVYSSVIEYYQNLVDTALNSQSEELLLNLIHMPTDAKYQLLDTQAKLLGIEQSLSEKQLLKIPAMIGKHVQAMNTKVCESVEPTIQRYWKTLWTIPNNELLEDKQDQIISLLSSLNGMMASRLIDRMDNYMFIDRVKQDVVDMVASYSPVPCKQITKTRFSWFFDWVPLFSECDRMLITKQLKNSDMELDFLRQHLSELKTNLLMKLHIQFIDFYARIQTDIIDQLADYYDE